MPRLASLLCLGSLLVTTPATATVDSGAFASLVALLGETERYAIFAPMDVNEGLLLDCPDLEVVDLEADVWRPRRLATRAAGAPRQVPLGLELPLSTDFLTETLTRCLKEHAPELAAQPLRPIGADDIRPLGALPAAIHASLERVHEGPVETLSFPCDHDRDQRCPTPCTGRVTADRLVLTDRGSGQRSHGATLTIDPTSLLQVYMGCETHPDDPPRPPETVHTAFEILDLAVVETERAFIVFGGVIHAPTANGTHLPLAAALRKDGRPFAPDREAYASPRGCACRGGGAPLGLLGGLCALWLGAQALRLRRRCDG